MALTRRVRGAAALAALAAAVACGGEGPGAVPAWSPTAAPLVFGATRDGRTDLWLHDPADGSTRPVVATERIEVAPALAPDGVRLAYHARPADGPFALYLAEPGGEGAEAARATALVEEAPDHAIGAVWSPDGREVAYFSTRGLEPGAAGEFPGHLYARDVSTGEERRLTRTPLPGTLGPSDWSADGRWILMARPFDGQIDVVRLEVATGEEERLTDAPEDEYSARFSGDGGRIAFHAEGEEGSALVVLDLESGARRAVTPGSGWWYGPVWSPDDRWLLATASEDGADFDVVAVGVEDGAVLPLVDTEEDERYGRWIPRSSPWAGTGRAGADR